MFDRLFKNRTEAGELLAQQLEAYARCPDAIVLALPRGGVPVGYVIAQALQLPLDVLLVRKLGTPGYEEFAMGAVASGGLRVINPDVTQMFGIDDAVIEAITQRESREIMRREQLYHSGHHMPLQLTDRVVILVDDGLATGYTMLAAVMALREKKPARVIVAVPVAARDAYEKIRAEADEIICLATPEAFHAVGQWYQDFSQTTDDEVTSLLERAGQHMTRPMHMRSGGLSANSVGKE